MSIRGLHALGTCHGLGMIFKFIKE
ncbi:uncharacterized protein METZ01_LOCUS108944 [marine metagenome]|uniref:Uncharacterized protein n=1 Tax=marine metagenome TaxID=408172 RepID=A0A381WUE3_9ZZZZ